MNFVVLITYNLCSLYGIHETQASRPEKFQRFLEKWLELLEKV